MSDTFDPGRAVTDGCAMCETDHRRTLIDRLTAELAVMTKDRNDARMAASQLGAAYDQCAADKRDRLREMQADRDRLAARVAELERLAGEACDIATQSSYAVSLVSERTARIRRINEIRSRLGGK